MKGLTKIESLHGGRETLAMTAVSGNTLEKGRGTMPKTHVPAQTGQQSNQTAQPPQGSQSEKK